MWLLSGCAVLDLARLNPFVGWLLETTGPSGFIAAKAAVTLLVLQAYPDLSRQA